MSSSRVHLAHHWAVSMRGGEKVLEEIAGLFPGAPISVLVNSLPDLTDELRSHPFQTSWIQALPRGNRYYRFFLPLFPLALRSLSVPAGTKLLFSSDASLIKGIPVSRDVPHVCYCHSPPRYLWDLQEAYVSAGSLSSRILGGCTPALRRYDFAAAQKVTHFIANSSFVQKRIRDFYQRDSVVIHPPVALGDFNVSRRDDGFYLIISELVAYKRVDLAVEAFRKLNLPLVVIGDGAAGARFRALAGPSTKFLGRQSFAVLRDHLERCRALVFPGIEDFGITPLEAQAVGKPVLAYRAGGALETVRENETGLFFDEQTPESLADCVERFEKTRGQFDADICRAQAECFRPEIFRQRIRDFLTEKFPNLFTDHSWPK